MANPQGALGGTYNPLTDYNRTGATDTGGTYTGATLVSPSITGATMTGTTASKAQVVAITATGTGSGDAAAITIGTPGFITITGASGAGIGLATGACVPGAAYDIRNINATGVETIYAVGATINGTTGTTGLPLSPTGTKAARLVCVTAGAWQVTGITTT